MVRNADCHTKNIALFYTSVDDVAFTPVYDIVTTQAYPRFAANPPGLPVDGRKTWAAGKTLERFFNTRIGIPPRQYAQMVEALCDSAVAVGHELIEACEATNRNGAGRQADAACVERRHESLRSPKKILQFKGLKPAIEAAGFSAPEPPERSREIIGRRRYSASAAEIRHRAGTVCKAKRKKPQRACGLFSSWTKVFATYASQR